MKTKDECYQQASFESLAESSTETRQDVIYRAMEIYANEKLGNFISSNPMLADVNLLKDFLLGLRFAEHPEIRKEAQRLLGIYFF